MQWQERWRAQMSPLGFPLEYIFIARVDMGRFIEPCQNKVQLIEGERPFQESRRPRMTKWESSGCRDHGRKEFLFY